MSILTVEHLSHQFLDKKLYDDTRLQLNKEDHMGIVGQNGVGKSTLIKILTGEQDADEAEIHWQKNISIGYLDQYAKLTKGLSIRDFLRTAFDDLYEDQNKMLAIYNESPTDEDLEKAGQIQEKLDISGFYDIDTRIEQVATGLGIDALGYDNDVSELSGGQRSKIILAKLLLQRPDALFLDEPTNYLDTNHIEWLENYLNSFEGAFIVISHDYDFLERITNVISDIEFGKITRYKGNLKQAFRQKEENRKTYLKAYAAQQQKIAKEKAYIAKFKAGSRSKSAKSREKQLNRMEVIGPPESHPIPKIDFPYAQTANSQMLIETNELVIGYTNPIVDAKFNFTVIAGEKIVIKGFNGIGKSTLIKTLISEIKPIEGDFAISPVTKMGYFKQDLKWDNKFATPFQILADLHPEADQKTVRRNLAKTGLTTQQAMSQIHTLSGGEQSKVKIADLMFNDYNLLFMDEPTNHLDDASKNSLKYALSHFEGAIVLVTHEDGFYDSSWIDKIIDIENLK
ncbi:multidrug ABC transporter ATP-binding protein [Companilactobacillus sp. RD055328]|uniref:ABC-F family ATP-binding cassette domain-containing protein n=1 Tax=Companilactobacillus sp. RD055328 TaxID=2916634 RepID=UPI001FC8681F|nr:ABC-F family ATP-binding cassette domain-containing protein [Companilactobacillus sp. RD055328]GKQ43476.1 multidrug ABC transporter ATP-binding protein [Companilactobacillus sp. RD055328]